MKRVLLLSILSLFAGLVHAQNFLPPQLELRVPFEPTAFPSDGRTYLVYELYLTNFSNRPITLGRIEVLNADGSTDKPVATFTSEQLDTMLETFAPRPAPASASDPNAPKAPSATEISGGKTIVAFMWVAFEAGTTVPSQLRHRVVVSDVAIEGAAISTHHSKLRVLGPPLEGDGWAALDGPSNHADNHHRRGLSALGGTTMISRRYAFDWQLQKDGAAFSGDSSNFSAYYSYGKPVLAVASARVVSTRNDLPDNKPGHGRDFHPAVPITLDTSPGNTVTLDLGGGHYAYYFHLQPGSIRVKQGDRVRRGQVLAAAGSSGDAREPHLHFEVTTSPQPLIGEGVPYVIEAYRAKAGDGPSQPRTRELPLRDMLVDFPH
jgi:hypothetical protein